jgi:hypothetical protein
MFCVFTLCIVVVDHESRNYNSCDSKVEHPRSPKQGCSDSIF